MSIKNRIIMMVKTWGRISYIEVICKNLNSSLKTKLFIGALYLADVIFYIMAMT